jgi:uncharacterized membrane protein (UPF0127 family)
MHHWIFILLPLFLWSAPLKKTKIELGGQFLTVEIADTPQSRNRGLMERKTLSDSEGMLFVYSKPEILSFWMKNTPLPLSIGFFNQKQVLILIEDMNPLKEGETPISYSSARPALYALEVPQGWFSKYGIGLGSKFSFLDLEN